MEEMVEGATRQIKNPTYEIFGVISCIARLAAEESGRQAAARQGEAAAAPVPPPRGRAGTAGTGGTLGRCQGGEEPSQTHPNLLLVIPFGVFLTFVWLGEQEFISPDRL